MSDNRARPYLICYDIADPKRLSRVHRHLKKIAAPLQYSVYHAELTPLSRERLLHELSQLIAPGEDDIRLYPIPRNPELIWLGERPLPEGFMLLSDTPFPY